MQNAKFRGKADYNKVVVTRSCALVKKHRRNLSQMRMEMQGKKVHN